jgi:hypothetical protein
MRPCAPPPPTYGWPSRPCYAAGDCSGLAALLDAATGEPWWPLTWLPDKVPASGAWADMDFDPEPAVARVACPTLLMYGEDEENVPAATSIAVWRRASPADLTVATRVFDEWFTVVADGRHRRRPPDPELGRDGGNCLPPVHRLGGTPPAEPARSTPRPDLFAGLGPGALGASPARCCATPLNPDQRDRPARRQIPHPAWPPVRQPGAHLNAFSITFGDRLPAAEPTN